MDMTLTERLARFLVRTDFEDCVSADALEDFVDVGWPDHEGRARRILIELLEPTGAMKDAGAETLGNLVGQPTRCWKAMLTAGLGPSTI